MALFPETAPAVPSQTDSRYLYAPPQRLHLLDRDEGGRLRLDPYVYDYTSTVDAASLRRIFTLDREQKVRVRFFVQGAPYKVLGLFPSSLRLIGPAEPGRPLYLLGADRLGRDLISQIIHGTQISMSIGLVGVALSLSIRHRPGGVSATMAGASITRYSGSSSSSAPSPPSSCCGWGWRPCPWIGRPWWCTLASP